MIEILFFL